MGSASTLRCKSCGAPIELRGGPASMVKVCEYCGTAMDLQDPNYRILFKYEQKVAFKPLIPLGARGTLRGEKLECIGYLRRSTQVEGVTYGWTEYLLYSPFKGYRWLVEEDGQWSLVHEMMALPTTPDGVLVAAEPPRGPVRYKGEIYKHFQSSHARVDYCLGEFYWAITAGQQTQNTDYIHPPYIISAEISGDEITWSGGQHLDAGEILTAFRLKEAAPHPTTVAANQPNPVGSVGQLWVQYLMYCMIGFLMTMVFAMMSKGKLIYHHEFEYHANQKERAFVTEFFEVPGPRAADLEVGVTTNVSNRWAFFHLALINEQTNEAVDFGIDTDYWSGVDDGEAWSEGSSSASVVLSHVEPGKYYLRVDPESGTTGDAEPFHPEKPAPGDVVFKYTLDAKSDVTLWSLWAYTMLLLLPVPIIQSIRSWAFESRRWSNSG